MAGFCHMESERGLGTAQADRTRTHARTHTRAHGTLFEQLISDLKAEVLALRRTASRPLPFPLAAVGPEPRTGRPRADHKAGFPPKLSLVCLFVCLFACLSVVSAGCAARAVGWLCGCVRPRARGRARALPQPRPTRRRCDVQSAIRAAERRRMCTARRRATRIDCDAQTDWRFGHFYLRRVREHSGVHRRLDQPRAVRRAPQHLRRRRPPLPLGCL